jgi:hypothetical protein
MGVFAKITPYPCPFSLRLGRNRQLLVTSCEPRIERS